MFSLFSTAKSGPEVPCDACDVGRPHRATSADSAPFVPSVARGVLNPICGRSSIVGAETESLPDVRCATARRAGINRPDGVARRFQVSLYKVEPTEAVRACNLLSKKDVRAALSEEMEDRRP